MADTPAASIDPEIKRLVPGLRLHLGHFAGARIGLAHHGLDQLRRRIFQRLRSALDGYEYFNDVPQIGVFMDLLSALGRDPEGQPPVHGRLIEDLMERRPFPVVNDAVDGANLTGLYYLLPVFLVDMRRLSGDIIFAPGEEHQALVTIDGEHPGVGEPYLMDEKGPIVGIQSAQVRGEVTQATAEFVVVLVDPGLSEGLDHDRIMHRLENWMRTLTGAHMAGSRLVT